MHSSRVGDLGAIPDVREASDGDAMPLLVNNRLGKDTNSSGSDSPVVVLSWEQQCAMVKRVSEQTFDEAKLALGLQALDARHVPARGAYTFVSFLMHLTECVTAFRSGISDRKSVV